MSIHFSCSDMQIMLTMFWPLHETLLALVLLWLYIVVCTLNFSVYPSVWFHSAFLHSRAEFVVVIWANLDGFLASNSSLSLCKFTFSSIRLSPSLSDHSKSKSAHHFLCQTTDNKPQPHNYNYIQNQSQPQWLLTAHCMVHWQSLNLKWGRHESETEIEMGCLISSGCLLLFSDHWIEQQEYNSFAIHFVSRKFCLSHIWAISETSTFWHQFHER